MKKILFPMLAAAFLAAGCANSPKELTAGIRTENLDTTADKGADFYQYACGGWMKLNPLTGEYSRFGSFDKLGQDNIARLNDLIAEIAAGQHEVGTEAQKIADFYNVAMDAERLNAEGYEPVKAELQRVAEITDVKGIAAFMGEDLYDIFFQVYVDADIMDAKRNLMQTYQAGIGMGNRDYYLSQDEKMVEIQGKYVEHIKNMFVLAGFSTEDAAMASEAVMNIERQLAFAHFSQAELRDSYANYHLYTTDSLKASFPGFCWDTYFETLGCAGVAELSVSQEEPIRKSIEIMNTARIEDLRYYMQWRVLSAASSYMSDEFVTERFNFFGRAMSGRTEETPRWKRAVSMVDGSLGMALGKLYCEKYFPAEAKTRMETLCANLLKAYGERIDNLEWMSDETKAKAHEKLSTFYVKVGYPNKWEDYTALEIDAKESYWTLVKRVSKFNTARSMAKLSKPVDKDEWYMNPQTVNAYYNPTTNEICFPAGILQYPFFDMEADDAFNYGAIGVVIAHEVTHGFDDMGSNFDKDGNYANWWTEEDKARFNERTKVMEEYFNGIKVNETMYANGKMSLGENIADHGGLQVAFHAFKNATKENPLPVKEGFTPEQRFFLAYSNVWAGNITEEEIVKRTLTDVHSLGKWRVNGALPHIAAWYEAFGITEEDALYLAPEKRVSIW